MYYLGLGWFIIVLNDFLFNWPSLRLPFGMLTVDMAENICSVGKVAALEPVGTCFGQGKPIKENTAERIKGLARKVGP